MIQLLVVVLVHLVHRCEINPSTHPIYGFCSHRRQGEEKVLEVRFPIIHIYIYIYAARLTDRALVIVVRLRPKLLIDHDRAVNELLTQLDRSDPIDGQYIYIERQKYLCSLRRDLSLILKSALRVSPGSLTKHIYQQQLSPI